MAKLFKPINKYIGLAKTKPEFLISGDNHEVSPEEWALLDSRAAKFSKLFLEIGSGSGGHLIESARRDPTSLYVGIELRFKRAFRTVEKAENQAVGNILVIRTNAKIVTSFFAEQSLDGIFINFPDPWDKRRWHKHRLLNESYLRTLLSLLKPGGFFSYKSDHEGYFREILALAKSIPEFSVEAVTEDLHQSQYAEENVLTEFEQLFMSQKLKAFFMRGRKN